MKKFLFALLLGLSAAPAFAGKTGCERALTPWPLLGKHPRFLEAVSMAKRAAPTTATVLIQGESGTGKELIARLIHNQSKRADKPFVAINCAALPANLIESELFGSEAGAFTGASKSTLGLVRAAEGGTLFLDEIGEMAPSAQGKLLRLLQERVVRAVGSNKEVPVDIRVIAATNAPLTEAIKTRKFREDLYHRLNIINLELPPLRERVMDIPYLALEFVKLFRGSYPMSPARILSINALSHLQGQSWPGNVRELRNVIERAVIFANGPVIELDDLQFDQQQNRKVTFLYNAPKNPPAPDDILDEFLVPPEGSIREIVWAQYAEWAFERFRFDLFNTADALGITTTTLREWLSFGKAQKVRERADYQLMAERFERFGDRFPSFHEQPEPVAADVTQPRKALPTAMSTQVSALQAFYAYYVNESFDGKLKFAIKVLDTDRIRVVAHLERVAEFSEQFPELKEAVRYFVAAHAQSLPNLRTFKQEHIPQLLGLER